MGSSAMFSDIQHLQGLFSSAWPATTITDDVTADGNTGSTWNYGASSTNAFGSGTPNDTHSGGVGAYGVFGVTDTGYTNTDTGHHPLPWHRRLRLLRLNCVS